MIAVTFLPGSKPRLLRPVPPTLAGAGMEKRPGENESFPGGIHVPAADAPLVEVTGIIKTFPGV